MAASDREIKRHVKMFQIAEKNLARTRADEKMLVTQKDNLLRAMFYELELLIPEIAELTGVPASTIRHACQQDPERYKKRMALIAHLVHRRRNPRRPAGG